MHSNTSEIVAGATLVQHKNKFKNATYVNVTIDLVKHVASEISGRKFGKHDKVPSSLFKASLLLLGFDQSEPYQKTKGVVIRSNTDRTKGYHTMLVSFKVKHDYSMMSNYRTVYDCQNDVFTAGIEPEDVNIDLSGFGLQHWSTTEREFG